MWYKNNYRRHLIDMHIDDWNDEFLSQFDTDAYVNNLINAKVQNAMIYLQSHVGLCNFPTQVGTMHKAFINKENTIRELAEKEEALGQVEARLAEIARKLQAERDALDEMVKILGKK